MTDINRQVKTEELDFDRIKVNIKDFFRGQDFFSDYDFEGSALSKLIDVLAYTTQYNAFYDTMAVNEMFLDSASKYASAVSVSKMLGYLPHSIRSARSVVDIVVSDVPGNPSVLTLPKGTVFSAQLSGSEYSFNTSTAHTANRVSNTYTFVGVELIEGTQLTKKYNVTTASKYVLPNRDIDTSTVSVRVQDNSTSNIYNVFIPVEDILTVRFNDRVYFTKQREDTLYEIYFGNDVIGKAVYPGNVVHIDYLLSSGEAANGANNFVYSGGFESAYSYAVTTTTVSTGGSAAESLESIKFNAPRARISQNRALGDDDTKTLLVNNFPNIESISVWGGQDNQPPIYGKIFIAAKPFNREYFTDSENEQFKDFLRAGKRVSTIIPETVDPNYLRIQFTTNVYYNPEIAKRSAGEIQSIVRQQIESYAESLNKFEKAFRFSRLSSLIDSCESSIVSNISTLKIRRAVSPIYNISARYEVNIENPIYQDKDTGGTFWSTRFFIGTETDRCYLKDDGAGNIDLYLENILGEARYLSTVGTINYSTGQIVIPTLLIRGLYDAELEFVYTPLSNDVIPFRQYIVTIPKELTTVNVLVDQIVAGNSKSRHTFSPSR